MERSDWFECVMRGLALHHDPTNGEIVVSYGSMTQGHSGKVILLTRALHGSHPPTEVTQILGEGEDLGAALADAVSKLTDEDLRRFPDPPPPP